MAMRGLEKMLQPLGLWKGIGIEQGDPIGFCFRECEVVSSGEAEIAARGDDAQIRQAAAEQGAFSRLGIIHQKNGGGLESLRAEAVKATRQCLKRLPIDDDDCDLASVHFKQATGGAQLAGNLPQSSGARQNAIGRPEGVSAAN